ncbi:PDZ domain-containing protein [Pseudidiomarina sediminum]|uniref:PDZ domain-containing protein n=1 Tax=Pseudidiomarina sediminum TaxID=431675 RepID=UPI001C986FC3|nr:PDZ domain-containing protein [Pseudidiomarina sediminum]MBY6062774.1 PDZ domain-containing protein [Pseudidiomarina sediminum]
MMKLSHFAIIIGSLALTSLSSMALGQEQEAREHARAAAVAAAKAKGRTDTFVMEEPARSYFNWGAVVHPNGEVMAISAGTIADAMGLAVGDQLIQVDDLALAQHSLKKIVSYLEALEHGSTFEIEVQREGQLVTLTGEALATVIPGWRLEVDTSSEQLNKAAADQCGKVSVFITPPQTRDLYPAYFARIDGDNAPPRKPIIKLSPGEHEIEVYELIDDPWVRRPRSGVSAKALSITVEPNTTYYIAAKFNRTKRLSSVSQDYWEPVVWKEVEQTCKGN